MAIQKLDPEKVPDQVKAAYAAAEVWLAERCKGRRIMPKPLIAALPVPEEGEDAMIHAILAPPSGEARTRISKSLMACATARDRGPGAMHDAAEAAQSLALVEIVYWVEGMPEPGGKDPRIVARDFLKELREEVGSLGVAFGSFGDAALRMLEAPETRLGKL